MGITTVTKVNTVRTEMNKGDLNTTAQVLEKAKFGNMMPVIKVVVTGATAAAAFDITTAAFLADGTVTVTGMTLNDGEVLPAIANCLTLRVTAATTGTFVGSYVLTDVAGDMLTAATSSVVGLARISNDGKTITFPTADVTAFILQYTARPDVDMDEAFPET